MHLVARQLLYFSSNSHILPKVGCTLTFFYNIFFSPILDFMPSIGSYTSQESYKVGQEARHLVIQVLWVKRLGKMRLIICWMKGLLWGRGSNKWYGRTRVSKTSPTSRHKPKSERKKKKNKRLILFQIKLFLWGRWSNEWNCTAQATVFRGTH